MLYFRERHVHAGIRAKDHWLHIRVTGDCNELVETISEFDARGAGARIIIIWHQCGSILPLPIFAVDVQYMRETNEGDISTQSFGSSHLTLSREEMAKFIGMCSHTKQHSRANWSVEGF